MVIYQLAVENEKASTVAVVFSGNPIFVSILAFFILREPIHKNNVIALALEVVGILIIMNPFGSQMNPLGIALSIISAVLFAFYGVMGKKKTRKYGSITVTCFSFIFGSLELLVMVMIGKIDAAANFFDSIGLSVFSHIDMLQGISLSILPALAYICIVNSAAGYVFYMLAMEKTSACEASVVFFLKPIFAPVLALIILGEVPSISMIIGIIFFLAGSLTSIVPDFYTNRLQSRGLQVQPIKIESDE